MNTLYLGEIRLFAFGRTPLGWKACNGQLLSIAENDTLFSLIGTTYGGDGQNTFALPDLRGRIPVCTGLGPGLSQYVLGQFSGNETETLTTAQMAAHNHGLTASSAPATVATPGPTLQPGSVSGETLYVSDVSGATTMAMSAANSTRPTGHGLSHENCMPTLAAHYCIAVEGPFPMP